MKNKRSALTDKNRIDSIMEDNNEGSGDEDKSSNMGISDFGEFKLGELQKSDSVQDSISIKSFQKEL